MRIYRYIYKTTNIVNGKYYIGKHETTNINDGYLGSGISLKRAIKKYGKENFKKEILIFKNSSQELYALEALYVTIIQVKNKNCYNIKVGGKGAASGKNNHMYGKSNKGIYKMSQAQKDYLSKNRMGKYKGEGNPFYGRKHSEEFILMMSEKGKERIGYKNPFFGKTHSDKFKEKCSLRMKEFYKNNPEEIEKISKYLNQSTGYWVTPIGKFTSSKEAAKATGFSSATIINICKKNCDKIVGFNYQIRKELQGNHTWRDLGYYFENFEDKINDKI